MVIPTLVLAAGLLAAAPAFDDNKPQVEASKGWVVELRGYTYHREAKPKVEWIIEVQWENPRAALKIDPVETQYHDDLRAFFEGLKKQKR
jgi:hypothetical protein